MTTFGDGQGVPVVIESPTQLVYDQTEELDYIPNCAVPLHRYAKLVGYEESAFWGVLVENQHLLGCGPIWDEFGRMQVAIALAEAQMQIEQVIGYPLCPTWIVGTVNEELNYDNRWVDQQKYKGRQVTRYPRLIAAGVRATEVIASAATVVHGPTVGTITLTDVSLPDLDQVEVYYPGTNRRIYPSRIVLSSGTLTIEIPRFRMVAQEFLNTPVGGIPYENTNFYLGSVDVVRVYNDPSTQAVIVRPNCANNFCSGGCSECTHAACIYIRDAHIGEIDVSPAVWNADTLSWNTKIACAGRYSLVRLNYLAGMRYLNLEAERAIVQLAHTKLRSCPCSCDVLTNVWTHDNSIPDLLTRERINCPFGLSHGAWVAYRWARNQASVRAGIL